MRSYANELFGANYKVLNILSVDYRNGLWVGMNHDEKIGSRSML